MDGVVVDGQTSLDEANLTGESRPVFKSIDDPIYAGTVNVGGGFIVMQTTSVAADSAVARLAKLVQDAASQRSPTEMTIQRVAKYYTPIVVLISLLLATVPFAWGLEVGMNTSLIRNSNSHG